MLSRRIAATTVVAGLGLLAAGLPGGCADTARDEQLARVAKDWSLVVRASQVIPVYPLTEDLMPGDVFLVRMSVPQQHREYQKRGFLPMDMHLTRLCGLDYPDFYMQSYGTEGKKNTPYHWQFPPDGHPVKTVADLLKPQVVPATGSPQPDGTGTGGTGAKPSSGSKPDSHRAPDPTLWTTAPRAAFPSYTFKVDAQGGIQAALPIQGVPVALSMMQTQRACGSVTLNDAYTYGVPFDKLAEKVHAWIHAPENAEYKATIRHIRRGVHEGNTLFSIFESAFKLLMLDFNERTVYLRVISRVYVVGSVTVALINTTQGEADAQAGATRNIELLNPALEAPQTPQASSRPAGGKTGSKGGSINADAGKADAAPRDPDTSPVKLASDFQKALEEINAQLGGAVKLRWATARSVSLDEDFSRPLVIGYLAFDFPVEKDGSLGTPIATQYQLEGKSKGTMPAFKPATPEQRDRVKCWLEKEQKNQHTNEDILNAWLKGRQIALNKAPTITWVHKDALSSDLADVISSLIDPQEKAEKSRTPEERASGKSGVPTPR